jgi:hypothetical protein
MSQNQAKKRIGSKTILYSPQTKNTLSCAMSQLKQLNTKSIQMGHLFECLQTVEWMHSTMINHNKICILFYCSLIQMRSSIDKMVTITK